MMKLKSLPTYFKTAKATDIETFDLRFEEAVSFLEQDAFDKAIPIIEQVLKEGCLDIRLIMHLFYAFFLKEGVRSFEESFPLLITLFQKQWEILSPIEMRKSHASKSVAWFFSTIGKRMKRSRDVYQEKRTDALWTRTAKLPFETISQVEEKTKELIDFFTNTWKLPSCHQHIQYTLKWLAEVKETFKQTPQPQLEEEPKEIVETPFLQTPSEEVPKKNPFSSPKMDQLLKKLALFETLLSDKNYKKASLIGSDIQNTIENFHPPSFFPTLFSNYFSLTAKHLDRLLIEWENKESPHWEVLENLYQTDLEAFVEW